MCNFYYTSTVLWPFDLLFSTSMLSMQHHSEALIIQCYLFWCKFQAYLIGVFWYFNKLHETAFSWDNTCHSLNPKHDFSTEITTAPQLYHISSINSENCIKIVLSLKCPNLPVTFIRPSSVHFCDLWTTVTVLSDYFVQYWCMLCA